MTTLSHRIISQSIAAPATAVYGLARQLERMPEWASGLATGVRREAGAWIAESPMGRLRIDMAPDSGLGVLDHDVALPDGTVVPNALRATPAGNGCVLAFVLPRQPGVSDPAFESDAAQVARDLASLKALAER